MPLGSFLRQLTETGCVRVPDPAGAAAGDRGEAEAVLVELDRHARAELAFEPPALHAAAALWAARTAYRACQLFVLPAEPEIWQNGPFEPCPATSTPEVVYSVDLTLCHLPELATMARIAAHQPLLQALAGLARAWPLSSVGVRGLGAVDVSSFIDHPSLRQLYVDRILTRRDADRLAEPRVREAVRAAIGAFATLAPEVAAAMDGGSSA